MAFSDEDLKFKITVDPDTAKMQEAIKDIGKELSAQEKQAKIAWDNLSKAGAAQFESIKANNKIREGFAAPVAIDPRLTQMAKITSEMEKQRELLTRINVEMDPSVLRERVALEKQLSDAKAAYVNAHGAEAERQGLTTKPTVLQSLDKGVGPAIKAALDNLGPLGQTIAKVGAVALVADYALKTVIGTIANFVHVASPGVWNQFNRAVRDLQGVIGQSLMPVLQLVTDAIRLLGDVLANILPNADEMREALAPLRLIFDAVAKAVRGLAVVFGPVFRVAIQAAIVYVTLLSVRVAALAIAAAAASASVKGIATALAVLGIVLAANAIVPGSGRSSQGAAALPAKIASGEAYQKANIESALAAASGQSIPQKQLSVLQQIRDILAREQRSTQNQPRLPSLTKDPHGINRALFGAP